jgi:hypothetical protein
MKQSYTIQRQVRLDQSTAGFLKEVATQTNRTISDVIRSGIRREIVHNILTEAIK